MVRTPSRVRTKSVNVPPTSMSIELRAVPVDPLVVVATAARTSAIRRSATPEPFGPSAWLRRSVTASPPVRRHGQAAVGHGELAAGQAGLQPVDVELDVDGDRMARWQVLRLHLGAAARAVELEDPHPVGVGREREGALDERRVDLPGVALMD